MIRLVLNHDHLDGALGEAFGSCRHRLFIATADAKDLRVPGVWGPDEAGKRSRRRRDYQTIVELFDALSREGVEIHLLHSGVPSGPLLAELKRHIPANLHMRRCPRAHVKAIIADGRLMYLGSANLTGAGLGAKSPRRRNFEAGIWTDEVALIDPVADMLEEIWSGTRCDDCGRKQHCPVPLEQPDL